MVLRQIAEAGLHIAHLRLGVQPVDSKDLLEVALKQFVECLSFVISNRTR